MKTAEKLTKKKIDSYVYNGGTDVRWDADVTGFGVRLYETGKKSFVLSYRVSGIKKTMVLGSYGILTVEEARNMARIKLADMLQGKEPVNGTKKNKGTNFMLFAEAYIENYAKKHKKTWEEDARKIKRHLAGIWKNRLLESITKADIIALHSKVGATTPYEANRLVKQISKMFELAKEWGYLPESNSNPAKSIKFFKEEKRDRWLSQEEMPRLVAAIEAEGNFYAKMAIWMYLFTGARKTELLTAKWSDIDMARCELRLEDTKAGRTHYIPLSKPAMELLERIPRIEDNPYIFPGHIKGKHLVNISKPWNRIKTQAKIENVRLHDLRRTVGSWLAQAGNSLHLIGKVLNHSNQSTTAVYARFAQNDVREALETHGQLLMGLVGKQKT